MDNREWTNSIRNRFFLHMILGYDVTVKIASDIRSSPSNTHYITSCIISPDEVLLCRWCEDTLGFLGTPLVLIVGANNPGNHQIHKHTVGSGILWFSKSTMTLYRSTIDNL